MTDETTALLTRIAAALETLADPRRFAVIERALTPMFFTATAPVSPAAPPVEPAPHLSDLDVRDGGEAVAQPASAVLDRDALANVLAVALPPHARRRWGITDVRNAAEAVARAATAPLEAEIARLTKDLAAAEKEAADAKAKLAETQTWSEQRIADLSDAATDLIAQLAAAEEKLDGWKRNAEALDGDEKRLLDKTQELHRQLAIAEERIKELTTVVPPSPEDAEKLRQLAREILGEVDGALLYINDLADAIADAVAAAAREQDRAACGRCADWGG